MIFTNRWGKSWEEKLEPKNVLKNTSRVWLDSRILLEYLEYSKMLNRVV